MLAIAVFDEDLPTASIGRLIAARVELSSVEDVMSSVEYAPHVHVVQNDDLNFGEGSDHHGPGDVVPFFVVERLSLQSSGQPTLTRLYSLHEAVVEMLTQSDDRSLAEDGELLRFAISSTSSDAGVNPFQAYHQRLRPLELENAMLRAALGFKKRDVVDLVAVKKKVASLAAANSVGRGSTRSHVSSASIKASTLTGVSSPDDADAAENTNQTESHNAPHNHSSGGSVAANGPLSASDPFSIHAPHLWEMETDAAVNARTKYRPYRSFSPSSRKLDLVTQQHLVVRLHDKSVDTMRLRRNGQLKELDASERRCLSPDEQLELGSRLHDRQREHSKKLLEELDTKFNRTTSPSRVLTSDELKQSTERVYREPMERKRNNLEKLIQRYVYDEEEKQAKIKLTMEQQKTIADRLSKK